MALLSLPARRRLGTWSSVTWSSTGSFNSGGVYNHGCGRVVNNARFWVIVYRTPISTLRGYSNLRVCSTCPQGRTVCWCSVCTCFGATPHFCFCLRAVKSPPWVRRVSPPKRVAYSYVRVVPVHRGRRCAVAVCSSASSKQVSDFFFLLYWPFNDLRGFATYRRRNGLRVGARIFSCMAPVHRGGRWAVAVCASASAKQMSKLAGFLVHVWRAFHPFGEVFSLTV